MKDTTRLYKARIPVKVYAEFTFWSKPGDELEKANELSEEIEIGKANFLGISAVFSNEELSFDENDFLDIDNIQVEERR